MGIAIKVTGTGAEILESVNTPDYDGRNGYVCLSRAGGDSAAVAALAALRARRVPDKYVVLNGRTPAEGDAARKVLVDAAIAALVLP